MVIQRDNSNEWYITERSSDLAEDILQMMDQNYYEASTLNESFWTEADIDTRFLAGDQTMYSTLYGPKQAFQSKSFYFNRIRRTINMIAGHQRKNRKSLVVTPRETGDQKTADQYTKVMFYVMNQCDGMEKISEAFQNGALTTGFSLLNVYMDYTRDITSGDIMMDHVPYSSFLIDPYFRKMDLSDAKFIWRRRWLSREEIKGLVPDSDDIVDNMSFAAGKQDGKFQYMIEAYNFFKNTLIPYDEYWYKCKRKATFLIDLRSGESMEWRSEDKDQLKALMAQYPYITKKTSWVPTTKLAIVANGQLLWHGQNPLGIDCYPFVPFIGYYHPDIPYYSYRMQGVVRGLRDAQYLYNRRKVIELDILESQITSGGKYKPGSMVNPADIFKSGQGEWMAIKDNADINDVMPNVPPSIPPSMMQISESLGNEIPQISGVNEELLGSAEDDKAGILAQLRQGAGLTTLQPLFDQLDFSMKQLGEVVLRTIQANFRPGKVKRIIAEEPAPQFYEKAFGQYDAIVEEGVNTSTQRQLAFMQALHLKELGIPIPTKRLLALATFQDKEELIQEIEQAEQQQAKMEQQQAMVDMEFVKARKENMDAKTIADQGLGIERISRVEENRSLAIERIAESQKDRQQGVLNLVKAIKEIQGMDIQHLEQLLSVVERLTQEEQSPTPQEAEATKRQSGSSISSASTSSQASPFGGGDQGSSLDSLSALSA